MALLVGVPFAAPLYAADESKVEGKAVFDKWCEPCHARDPRKHPGTVALGVLYKNGEKPAALQDRLDLTPELVATYVRNGVSIMPFSRKTEISDAELAELGAYLSVPEK
ncbi:MAG: cytochrome c [Pseudomonadota bacterium]